MYSLIDAGSSSSDPSNVSDLYGSIKVTGAVGQNSSPLVDFVISHP